MDDRFTEHSGEKPRETIELGKEQSECLLNDAVHTKKIIMAYCFSYTWTLFLTAIPLGASVGPTTYYAGHPHWYQGDDVMRLLEPLFGLYLNFLIVYLSGIVKKELDSKGWILVFTFFFGVALYEQGAGFHSCANMFKNALQTINYDDGEMSDFFWWVRTVWEHTIGHYMYAIGYGIMTAVQLYLYKDLKIENISTFPMLYRCLLFGASLLYALLIAGVSADFPSGVIVGIVYLILYGFCCVGGYVYYEYKYTGDRTILQYQSRPIVHHFLLTYVMAFIFILIYIASVGGLKSRSQAGIN